MNNISLLYTLGGGTLLAFALFFSFYLGLKWEGKKSAFLAIIIMWLLYFPLAYLYWPGIDVFAIHFVFYTMTGYGLGIITNVRSTRMRREGEATQGGWFHWGPAIIVTFFLLLTIVEANLISVSGLRKPGIVVHDFREKENQYNDYQKQLAKQKQRGWKITGGWEKQPLRNISQPFIIKAADNKGSAITQAQVTLVLLSTVDTDKDMHLTLAETSEGIYSKEIMLPLYGEWTILVTVTKADDVHVIKGKIEVEAEQKLTSEPDSPS
ncbi:MAG: FixH family protein [Cocleimonas sp.]|nr:FixH family protein [Cocleimonas sp.]